MRAPATRPSLTPAASSREFAVDMQGLRMVPVAEMAQKKSAEDRGAVCPASSVLFLQKLIGFSYLLDLNRRPCGIERTLNLHALSFVLLHFLLMVDVIRVASIIL